MDRLTENRADRLAGLFEPATVVLFAGLGGACIGIEQAYTDGGFRDRYVDLCVNHWDVAVKVHELNHPMTEHLHADVWEVDPAKVLRGRKIGYLHASPDCTDFSKAKGGMPKRKHIRALADVVLVWAEKRRPDVITLENVEEFLEWGPLMHKRHSKRQWCWIKRRAASDKPVLSILGPKMNSPGAAAWIESHESAGWSVEPHLMPDPDQRGKEFTRWREHLEGLGYVFDHRELRACNHGTPTTRNRLVVVARCDGLPIVWPEKTHGPIHDSSRSRGAGGALDPLRQGKSVGAVDVEPIGIDPARGQRFRIPRGIRKAGDRRSSDGRSAFVSRENRLAPFRTAAGCIDWSQPMLSILATRAEARRWAKRWNRFRTVLDRLGVPQRPLKIKTQQRIAGGLLKHVLNASEPFIINIENYGWDSSGRGRSAGDPLSTVTAGPRGGKHAAVDVAFTGMFNHGGHDYRTNDARQPMSSITGARDARGVVDVQTIPFTAGVGGRAGQSPATRADAPIPTVTAKADRVLCAVVLDKHYSGVFGRPIDGPADTITTTDHHGITAAHLAPITIGAGGPIYSGKPRRSDLPLNTVTVDDRKAVATAFITKFKGTKQTSGAGVTGTSPADPLQTITGNAQNYAATAVYLSHAYTSNTNGGQGSPLYPHKTITSEQHSSVCCVYLAAYYGEGSGKTGHAMSRPMPSVVSKDRFALASLESTPHWIFTPAGLARAKQVARWAVKMLGKKVAGHLLHVADPETGKRFALLMLKLKGAVHIVTDIAMRMLRPRELARAQGFSDSYVIDRTVDGQPVSRSNQVKLIGNSVCPQVMRAVAWANVVKAGVLGPIRRVRRREAVPA